VPILTLAENNGKAELSKAAAAFLSSLKINSNESNNNEEKEVVIMH
jgi:hypothetical protein